MTAFRDARDRRQRGHTRQFLVRLLSVLITVVLLAILIGDVKWGEFDGLVARVSIGSWLLALLAYLALNLFRAWRFRILLDASAAPARMLVPITLYHNFLVRALPFKIGEVSYIVLLRSRLRLSPEQSLSSLVGARLLELLVIVLVFAASIPASADQFADQRDELLLAIGLTFAAGMIALYFGGALIRLFLRALQHVIGDRRPARTLAGRLNQLAAEMDRIRQPRLFASALVITCLTYSCSFLANYALLRALGLDTALPVAVAIVSLGMFASAFPFTISGFGVVEVAWRVGLTELAGFSLSDATATGFLLHGFQLFAAAVYGLAGYLWIQFSAPVDQEAAPPESG